MTPQQFYEWLSEQSGNSVATMAPGPFKIRLCPADAYAARLLLWLAEILPADATIGNLHDTLDAARFWSTFWAAQEKEDDES